MKANLPRPPSAVSSATGWWGIAAFAIALAAIKLGQFSNLTSVAVVVLLPLAAMLSWEVVVVHPWRAPDSPVNRDLLKIQTHDTGRLIRKCIGFVVAFALLLPWFMFVPHYNQSFAWVLRLIAYSAPLWFGLGIIYIIWLDPRLKQPHDGAWHLGQIIAQTLRLPLPAELPRPGKAPKQAKPKEAIHFLLGWFIKAFFFVFLLHSLPAYIAQLQREPFDPFNSLFRLVFTLTPLLFAIDVVLATIGYLCTFKALNAHIRTPNALWLGWLAALACYPPFALIGSFKYTDFRVGGTYWDLWITNPPMKWIWAIGLLSCLVMYVWATASFGIRFSNLTNRGTITHGPYRLFRHPAYVSKNMYWWLIYVPWVSQSGPKQAMINCALLLLLTAIYWLRAYTEELHLRTDPEYRAYVRWFESSSLWERIRAR